MSKALPFKGTFGESKAMPKPLKVIDTSHPLGAKINEVMAAKDMAGDYAALARTFDVKPPSVRDWVEHGRLGKERYPRLVEWSGRSLDWWFDVPANYVTLSASASATAEQAAPSPWPFHTISGGEYSLLSEFQRGEVEGFVRGLLAQAGSKKRTGTSG
ncbi:MAG: hypothetical protein J0H69_19615 [Burkholderiales bacterium]|nr:hypothetical protein [Burkholderiales bacterium]